MSENSIIGKILRLDNQEITLTSGLSKTSHSSYHIATSSKKPEYLVQYFNSEQLQHFCSELKAYDSVKGIPNMLKMIFKSSNENFSIIVYKLPENLDFYSKLGTLLETSKKLMLFLNQFINFLHNIHEKGFIYTKINVECLFFDAGMNLQVGGFSGLKKIQCPQKITTEEFDYITGQKQLSQSEELDLSFLGDSLDFLRFGEFLKFHILNKKVCKCSVKNTCNTYNMLNVLVQTLTNPNPSLRPGYETLKYLLNPRYFCRFNIIGKKKKPTTYKDHMGVLLNRLSNLKLSSDIPELLRDMNENKFDLEYLNQVLIEIKSDETAFKDFTLFVKNHSSLLNYSLTLRMMILNYFLFICLETSSIKGIKKFDYLDESTCEYINKKQLGVKSKESPLELFHKFYLVLRHKSYIIEEHLKFSPLEKIKNMQEKYFKRILEFLQLVLSDHISYLFYLEDIVFVLMFQELYSLSKEMDQFPVIEHPSGGFSDSKEIFEDLIKKYKITLNLKLWKNTPILKHPLIFQHTDQSLISFQLLSRFISGDSDSSFGIPLDDKNREKVLGIGSGGIVFKNIYNGLPVAVKQLFTSQDNQEKSFLREVSLLSQHFHPNIISLYGVSLNSEHIKLVYPFMEGGDLHRFLHGFDVILTPAQNISICIDLAQSLNYLHTNNVIHRDLKPLNVLIEKPITSEKDFISLKIADFGLSRYEANAMTKNVGTVHWNSPEVLNGQDYTTKSDIFSLGIVFWQIFTRCIPYSELTDEYDLSNKIITEEISNGRIPDVEKIQAGCWSSDIQELIVDCLSFCPTHRPTAGKILEILMGMIS